MNDKYVLQIDTTSSLDDGYYNERWNNNGILENNSLKSKVILLALNKLLVPHCKGMLDVNGETRCNVELINRYRETKKILEDM